MSSNPCCSGLRRQTAEGVVRGVAYHPRQRVLLAARLECRLAAGSRPRNGDERRCLVLWAVRESTSHWGLCLDLLSLTPGSVGSPKGDCAVCWARFLQARCPSFHWINSMECTLIIVTRVIMMSVCFVGLREWRVVEEFHVGVYSLRRSLFPMSRPHPADRCSSHDGLVSQPTSKC